ncbi:MAG: efflux RND transporter permease subunit [candidate division KSB1 bacterium]|nr:efflux RND transporter permease subunit [candidate division KSB1 bacterium]MDZ7300682.1 efflux RND transporter permease subunit [candidate division KSB1 bacterium]MDZ7309818.1 efflux RND transporter permease subunit [candidate division KSB1 bacterium]
MMRWMVSASMRLRLVVAAAAALLLVFGFTQLRKMPVDTLPEFSRPYVEIQIEALGLSAQEVEAMITTPLEADMLNGCPWAEEIRSVSLPGLSSITLVFEKGTDIMRARQVTQERLIEIFALPQVSNQFTMINPVSSAGRVMEIGLTSDKLSLIEMSVLARWTVVPRLMGLPGVANVSIWGERMRQLQVQVDPERLRAEGLDLMQIIKTAGNSLWASPLSFLEASTPGTGGWIDTPNQRLTIRHILPIQTAEDLAKVPIEGAPKKRLGDVTTVVEDHQPLIGDALVKHEPSLILVVEKFPWANTKDVTKQVEKALADLRPAVSGMEMDPTLFRPATYLELAVDNLSSALLLGAGLLIVAFLAFLFNWRTALISIVTVLMSVIAAVIVLYVSGVTMNMMIIAGLMIAVGAIIDTAIVDTENIVRRLRQAREEGYAHGGNGKSAATIIYEAIIEMHHSFLYATVIIVLAVIPVLFLEGVSGAFWQPVATSYILALLASFVAALTVTPALSVLLLRTSSLRAGESPVVRMLRGLYNSLLGWAARVPRPAFVAVCVLLVAGIVSLPFLRQESLLPDLKETDLLVRMEGSSSASHPAMSRVMTLASRELRAIPGVHSVSALMGRAIMSDKRTNINAGELLVSIDPAADYEATVAAVKQTVAGYPGLSPEVLTYLQARVREELSGTGESLVVRVYGEDMDMIRKKAEEVQRVLSKIDGLTDAQVQYPQEMPTLEIEVDVEKAKLYHLKPGDVRRAATSLVSGIIVGALFEEQKVFDVVVWGTPETRHSMTSVQNLLIDTPSGGHVRLKEVAKVRIVPSVTAIHRDAVARRMDVTANVRRRDYASVAADIESGLEQITFPLEYRAELLGEYAERLAAQNRLLAYAIAAAIGIFLLLQVYFRSWRLTTAIFFTLPMALVGGVLTAVVTNGGLLSFGAIVGFIAVLGIAVRNVITLISRYRQLEKENGEVFGAELVQAGTLEQSAPILMTAIATALAFLPLTFFGNIAGLEIVRPMAFIVLGGLVTATLYTLAGVPAIYLLFGAKREPELDLKVTVVTEEEMREAIARTREMGEAKQFAN